ARLTKEDVEESDIVLTMTRGHKAVILSAMPHCEEKVFTLGEYIGGGDITDPYGGSEEVYQKCAEELYEYIERVVEKLK
ncbi:MAG: low molecular weight protein arginine phosphatase, partial [Clostridia bacterium]|nr:low molecular weight protein arginine phosphatase [Clostridia bacterium]